MAMLNNSIAQCQQNQQQSKGNLLKTIESANGLKSILAEENGNDMKLCQWDKWHMVSPQTSKPCIVAT